MFFGQFICGCGPLMCPNSSSQQLICFDDIQFRLVDKAISIVVISYFVFG